MGDTPVSSRLSECEGDIDSGVTRLRTLRSLMNEEGLWDLCGSIVLLFLGPWEMVKCALTCKCWHQLWSRMPRYYTLWSLDGTWLLHSIIWVGLQRKQCLVVAVLFRDAWWRRQIYRPLDRAVIESDSSPWLQPLPSWCYYNRVMTALELCSVTDIISPSPKFCMVISTPGSMLLCATAQLELGPWRVRSIRTCSEDKLVLENVQYNSVMPITLLVQ